MLFELSLSAAEVRLKCFVRVSVNVSDLEGPGCRKEQNQQPSGLLLSSQCHLALLSWLDDLARRYLNFWNMQDIFPGSWYWLIWLICGTYVKVALEFLESVGCWG